MNTTADRQRKECVAGRLRQRDVNAILDFLPKLYSLKNEEARTKELVSTLPEIIPAEIAQFYSGDATNTDRTTTTYPDIFPISEIDQIIFRWLDELKDGVHASSKTSDHMCKRHYYNLNLYNELYRAYDIEDMLDCSIADDSQPAFWNVLALMRDKDFDDNEKLILELLRPHLKQALQNAKALTGVHQEFAQLKNAVESLERGIVILDEAGRVKLMTPLAWNWLAEYFDQPSRMEALPDTVEQWLRGEKGKLAVKDDLPPPLTPLIVEKDGKQLCLRLTSDPYSNLLVLEEIVSAILPRTILERFSVTEREAEVLYWVTEGKTNIEIGTILSTSVRTVGKHLEHIFQKIGVETRTAAATLVLDTLK